MVVLTVQDLHQAFGPTKVLDGVSFAIGTNERVGLVGANGSGKSTLGRLVAGAMTPDDGKITLQRDATVGYLEQVPRLDPEATPKQIVLAGLGAWSEAKARYDACSRALERGDGDLERLLADQTRAGEDLERLGGWDVMHRAEAVLGHLDVRRPDDPVGPMSGGEQRRIALARLLVSRPTLAILDEPTNHLDVETIEWLERYLSDEYTGALLLITHDRWLLDSVVDRTLELEHGQIYAYDGGYGDYLEAKAERMALAERTEANRQNFLRRELQWLRRQPKARTGKQKARIARAQAAIEAAPAAKQRGVKLEAGVTRTGKTIVDLEDLKIELGGKTLIEGLTMALQKGDRLGIVGRNGTGKTSLLRTLTGELEPTSGQARLGKNTAIAYLDQTRSGLDLDATIFENVAGNRTHVELGERSMEMRVWLEHFAFDGTAARKKVSVLSGGERARVALAKMLSDPSNVLLLDEPTNDLDVATLGALETLLVDYGGTCIVVTHDRYFLDRVATAILAFEGDGRVVRYEGNYTTYQRLRREAPRPEEPDAAVSKGETESKTKPKPKPKTKSGLTYAERLELEKLDGKIERAEGAVSQAEAVLGAPETYENPDAARDAARALDEAKAELETLMLRWEELELKKEGG